MEPRGLEIIVDDNLVEDARSLCEFELVLRLGEALDDGVFGVCGTAAQTFLEDLDGRRLQGKVASVEVGLFDLLDTL